MARKDRFSRHAPGPTAVDLMDRIKEAFRNVEDVMSAIPDHREKSLSLTALEDAYMRANRAAIYTDPESVPVD